VNAINTQPKVRTSALNEILTATFTAHLFTLWTAGCVLVVFGLAHRLI
jgi:hypothetical protein